MAVRVKRAFSGFLGQLAVVCLLAVLIVVTLIAMFSTAWLSNEVEWIGMTAKPLEAEAAAALGIPGRAGGVIVGEVEGIAERAGIRRGDVIQGIGGKAVRDLVDFAKLAGQTDLSRGGTVLDVIRRGSRIPLFVRPLGGVAPALGQSAPRGIAAAPLAIERDWLGIEAELFTAGPDRALGIPAGVQGVLIDGVARGSRAAQAGLSANDVIVAVNGQKIVTTTELWNALAGLDTGARVEFGVYRRGRLMSVVQPAERGVRARGFPGGMGG